MAEEELVKKVMPHSTDAEKAVLGGLLLNSNKMKIVEEVLPSGAFFYNSQFGIVYDAMLELSRAGRAIDTLTVPEKLKEKKVPDEINNPGFFADLIANAMTSAHIKQYAEMIAEKATLRELIKATDEISNTCFSGDGNVSEILENTEKKIFKIVQKKSIGELTPIDQVVMDSLDVIEKAAKIKGDVTGLGTGFTDLDRRTSGFQPGNLVLIAARPAMGKTSFVLSLAKNVVINQKKPIAMFSLEMSKTELVNRLLSMDSKVDSQKFKTGQLNEADWESLIESAGNIGNSQLILDDSSFTISDIRSKCRKLKIENKIELVIIDYLQLMNSGGRSDSRQHEISEISRALKLMAKELGIPVIALSQLSRQVEQRPDHRPMLSDLRESGAIEQDADCVLFIYRDEVYHADTPDKNIAELIIAKQRSGPTGTVKLAWLPEYTQFANLQL